jgi:short-subunit dehydrogenase
MTLVTDFRDGTTLEYWDSLHAKISHLDCAVLVNNVGINYTEHFEHISERFLLDLLSVNCTSQMMMTRKILPGDHVLQVQGGG